MICSQCNERDATFKINGKIKTDHEHDMCRQCYESLKEGNQNSVSTPSIPYLFWDQRREIFKYYKIKANEQYIVFMPNYNIIEDSLYCKITISPYQTTIRFFDSKCEITSHIPDLAYLWSEDTLKYIMHWYYKVLDDPYIKNYNHIIIERIK